MAARLLPLASVLLIVAVAGLAAGAHTLTAPTTLDHGFVGHEPDTIADTDNPRNGFYVTAPHRWDLVLDAWYDPGVPGVVGLDAPANQRAVAYQILAELGMDPDAVGPLLLPGPQDHGAWWGWWKDKGSGAYLREDGTGDTATGSDPDGYVDDGSDDHAADRSLDDARRNPRASAHRWSGTGPWDEFVWRGDNPHVAADRIRVPRTNVGPDDPAVQAFPGDRLHGFVQPGTRPTWWSAATGREGSPWSSSVAGPLPGYGVVTGGADGPRVPDWEHAFHVDRTWFGATAVGLEASLLAANTVTVAANAPLALGGERSLAEAEAVDVDSYVAPGPLPLLYRTAVWDPHDEADGADAVLPDRGAKAAVKAFTEGAWPRLDRSLDEASRGPLDPLRVAAGTADDAVFAPRPHEPNHPDDDYPAAGYSDGATYRDGVHGPYYEPTQDWSGYAGDEHLWADGQATLAAGPVPLGFHYGYNVDGSRGEQGTAGPGRLAVHARVGSWWDATGDTWVGDIDAPARCTSPDDPYCQGTVDDPNDHSHNPTRTRSWDEPPEWRGSCQGRVTVTLVPRSGVRDDEGRPGWGSRKPPAGVYLVPDAEAGSRDPGWAAGSTYRSARDGYVRYGNVTLDLEPDRERCQAGAWHPTSRLLLPTGTATYPVEVRLEVDGLESPRYSRWSGERIDGERVLDVDRVEAWETVDR